MLFWLETATRFHTDPAHHAVVALKTVVTPSDDENATSALYVWEVAWCEERGGMKWQFIVWDVSGYGVRFRDCASRKEAMALYNLPTAGGLAAVGASPGVYLRADRRPR